DMFELGDYSAQEHQQLAKRLENSSIDAVYLLGKNFQGTTTGKAVKKYTSYEEFRENFDPEDFKGATILINGSRGMDLERIIDLFVRISEEIHEPRSNVERLLLFQVKQLRKKWVILGSNQ